VYLKRLELHGFKSFAPRTVLEFSPGMTAIVGPNGSGKSNVADGIRWVLGEQSMRLLRGKKSDDVIFAGGHGRSAMQMAEVGLVLDNSAAWLPSEFSEVTVSRRSFRSGDSEYLINGQRVRLKDVLLLLAQARIGHDSYTVIGQGLVDQTLSQRAEERRGLFEDAAGIRQFQAQRQDAEQKLALTQSNLARLRDIIGEIEPRLGPLEEQARRAHEYTDARSELSRLLRRWYHRQWLELQSARERAESVESATQIRIQKLQDALAVEDALTQDLRRQREEVLAATATLRRERGEASNRLQTIERELAVARERLASLERQESDLTSEQEQQAEAADVARAHAGALDAQLAAAEEQAHQLAADLDTLERGLHTARQEQEREEARLRAAQREVIQVQARLGAAQAEHGRLQRQLGERNRALATRREAVAQAQRKLDTAEQQLEAKRQAFEAARAAVEALVAQRDQLAHEIADGQTEVERLRGAIADAEREQRALADRLALLAEWQRNLEGFGDGVRALLQAPLDSRPSVLGVVAQLVTASAGLDLAVEAALGPFLHAAVMNSADEARRGAEWLRASGKGRAIFLWPDIAPGPADASHPDLALPKPDGREYFGYVRDVISCRPELQTLMRRLVRDAYIVRDLDVADRHAQEYGLTVPLVTLDGELVHPRGWLRGGKVEAKAGAGSASKETSVLARERELRRLPADVERLNGVIVELQAQQTRVVQVQEERRERFAGIQKEIQRAEAQAQELARSLTALQREHERIHGEVQLSSGLADQLAAEVSGIEQEVAATAARVAEQEEAQREAAERAEDVQAEVDELLARNRGQQEELARARTSLAVQQQEVKALAQRAEQLRGQLREIELQMSRRATRTETLRVQREQLLDATAGQEETLDELRTRVRELGEQLREQDARQADLDRQIRELEHGQSTERQELARLEVEYRRLIVESQRARDAVEALAQQIREEMATDSDEDPLAAFLARVARQQEDADDEPGTPTPEEAARMRRQIDQLRNRLKHLGGYDPEAPQAYEELRTRYEFLTGQVRDMEQATTNLRAVIAELDVTMRRQFEETFQAVNLRFQRHFTTLFAGGAARLELTSPRRQRSDDDEDEDGEQQPPAQRGLGIGGIEVYVQVPGKKVQDLSLLSGGERAMVSAALLFALLETNPPPFCLLDEVDAALDETNVVRFCETLRVLAERTQFIVITHNRVTATHANAIYGISMENSVSRVLSMKLAEVAVAQ
jgi:chromosome segregation protein